MSIRKETEADIQKSVIAHLETMGYYVFSVPNEARRSYGLAKRLKATGMKAGVADLVVLGCGEVFFIEVKSKTGKQQSTQKAFQDEVEKRGLKYILARSIDDLTFLKRCIV